MNSKDSQLALLILAFWTWILWSPITAAEFVVPRLTGPVVDNAQLISESLERKLDRAIRELKKQTGTQLQVLTVPELGGLEIEQASIQVVDAWKLGGEDTDRGVLLMIALKERKLRIEVGQGLEGDLPDAYAKRIIDQTMVPLIREGDFDSAVLLGVLQIAQRTDPNVNLQDFFNGRELTIKTHHSKTSKPSRAVMLLLLLGALFLFIRHPRLLLLILAGRSMGSGGRYHGGYGGGFGGGGWSGGGGGFSGGGASGSW